MIFNVIPLTRKLPVNSQRKYKHVACAVLFALIAGCERPAAAPKVEESLEQPVPGFASPQLVFDEAKTGAIANDTERILRCFTSESQDGFATYTLVAASMMRMVADGFAARGDDRYVASKAKVDAVLRKHSIDLSAISGGGFEPGSANMTTINGLVDSIADKPTLISELLRELEAAKGGDTTGFQEELLGTLSDVRIEGDTAEAVVADSSSATSEPLAFYFRKSDDGWLIHMPPPTE